MMDNPTVTMLAGIVRESAKKVTDARQASATLADTVAANTATPASNPPGKNG